MLILEKSTADKVKATGAYKAIKANGYSVENSYGKNKMHLFICFPDGELYADFLIKYGYGCFMIYADGENITARVDFSDNLADCIISCLGYFENCY